MTTLRLTKEFMQAMGLDVSMSRQKELNYFTAHYDRGGIWYEAQFEVREGAPRGEFSPNYFCSLDAPIRAARYNPDLKLIALLRDPVARVISNHLHEIREQHIAPTTSLAQAMAENETYLGQSHYKANLERWLDQFSSEQLLILLAEEAVAEPAVALAQVSAHLGVDPPPLSEAVHERRNENVRYHNAALRRVLQAGGDQMRAWGLHKTLKTIKALPGLQQLLDRNKQDLRTIPTITTSERCELAHWFAEDMAFVADHLKR
ncbi:MAG: sulfotransferase, partial [Verrucomicrobiota bacterium]